MNFVFFSYSKMEEFFWFCWKFNTVNLECWCNFYFTNFQFPSYSRGLEFVI